MEIPKTLVGNRWLLAITLLAAIGIGWRLLPHLPNFAPIGAIALTTGALLPKKSAALLLLTIMFITDAVIGFYSGFWWTWIGLALIIPVGIAVRKLPFITKTTLGSISASLIFYTVSNFGVWLCSGMYAPTAEGLLLCYIMALPFLWVTAASDLAFSAVLFGLATHLRHVPIALSHQSAMPIAPTTVLPETK